jgi:hypothetical protein
MSLLRDAVLRYQARPRRYTRVCVRCGQRVGWDLVVCPQCHKVSQPVLVALLALIFAAALAVGLFTAL